MKLKKYMKDIELSKIPDILMKDCKPFIDEIRKGRKVGFLYRGTEKNILNLKKVKPRKDRKPKDMPEDLHKLFDKLFKKEFGWKARSEGTFVSGFIGIATSYGKPCLFFPIGNYKYIWSLEIEDLYSEVEESGYLHEFESSLFLTSCDYEYHDIYGYEKTGTFEYDGIDLKTNDERDAMNIAMESLGDKESFDSHLLEWIPEITFEEYMDDKEAEYESNRYNFISDLVGGYTNKNLINIIGYRNEISFKCNSYYLVDVKYADILQEKIFGKKGNIL